MVDDIARINGMSAYDVIRSLTINDVENFIHSLGVERIVRQNDYLILPTICHNPIDEATSMKLYYYDNHKCFHCYTQCGDSMSIIELYQKFMDINGSPIEFDDAVDYIKQFITTGIVYREKSKGSNYIIDNEKFLWYNNIVEQPEYPPHIMDMFVKYYPPQWIYEGITKEAMDKYNIRFSITQNKAIIPHYDINGRIIGIRGRAFNKDEIDDCGKYRPVTVGDTIYKHHLSYNLYGIYENQEAIRKTRKAIIVEAEKSVLLGDKYMGDYNICVAVCGSSINKYQIALLTQELNVNEIIVAFDHDFTKVRSEAARKCRKKILEQCKKYTREANFSYIFDEHDILKEHDSPLDRGQEVWEKLYKERIKVI